MNAILRITEGPAPQSSLAVETGQTVTVGRGDQARFRVSADSLMSSLHFSVRCDAQACLLEDLHSTNGTTVNGQPAAKKELRDGDVVQAGNTVFRVSLQRPRTAGETPTRAPARQEQDTAEVRLPVPAHDHHHQPPQKAAPALDAAELGPERGFAAESAQDIVQRFQFTSSQGLLPGDGEPPEAYAQRLAQQDELSEALTFLAYALPKRCSIWWAICCIRAVCKALTPDDEAVLQAAEAWVKDPTDQNRRQAMDRAVKQNCDSAACWPAVAAFWSHGSMAPANCPPVPPADELCGKAVSGAVRLAAVQSEPEKVLEKHCQFLHLALTVASGENSWKE